MKISRRETLGLLAGTAVVGGCTSIAQKLEQDNEPLSPLALSDDPAVRRLNRFGFGPRPGDVQAFRKLGDEGWLQAQLNPGAEPVALTLALRQLDIFHFSAPELRDFSEDMVVKQMQQAAMLRAVQSPWQLRERLVDFWTNHFNIFARKGLAAFRKPADERNVIRKHALGSFREMLKASAQSSAMLVYLDQQASHRLQPNENYARELMELHTLGVHGGYSQKDVMEVARCFTGWSEERRFLRPRGQFRFIPELHDDGEKVVLGQRIPAGQGEKDGLQVVEILANHPGTAKHIAQKLCRFFLGDAGTEVEAEVAKVYRETGGQIGPMVTAIYRHPVATNSPPMLKRPFDYVVSALRATDANTDGGDALLARLSNMGQPLYLWPMPDGYPDQTEAWSGSLLARWNFAFDLMHGKIDGTSVDRERLARLFPEAAEEAHIFHRHPESTSLIDPQDALGAIANAADRYALLIASPEFQWR